MLVRHGYGVLLFDRRGEGASEGDPNMWGWGGERDIHAAVDFLQHRPDVDPDRIGGIGFSVGGELMLQAAAENDGLAAVVSEGAGHRSLKEEMVEYDGRTLLRGFHALRRQAGRDRPVRRRAAAAQPGRSGAPDRAPTRRCSSGRRTAATRRR